MHRSTTLWCSSARPKTCLRRSAKRWSTQPFSELNNHKNDHNNPHKVTKEQIGLGNVENKALIDQTPTFVAANELSDIASGEKMGSILGKIAKALSLLKSHLSNFNNPHKVKAADIGAAASKHSHNANDINDGTVIVQRGGTGRNEWTKNCIVFRGR